MNLEELAAAVRGYRGVTRKAPVLEVARSLICIDDKSVIAAYGEDAAALKFGDQILLLAADGILQDLVRKNPYWAGYCSVLVNVNDIAAMGGLPIAMVNVLSCGKTSERHAIVKGMSAACSKFGVRMVGGHLHPDTSYSAVAVAILGRTDMRHLVLSSGAREGDSVLFAIDLDGRFTPGIPYSWDTTSRKTPQEIRALVGTMHAVAPHLTAGKDISNPGSLGTLGMLLESSRCGAEIYVDSIPRPERVELLRWLLAYQGCGFVVTCRETKKEKVLRLFRARGFEIAACGRVTDDLRLTIVRDGQRTVLFDLRKHTFGCRPPQKI